MLKPYNGHRSWNAWNVALWISNDEPLYRAACDAIAWARVNTPNTVARRDAAILRRAVARFSRTAISLDERTPDGAVYNRLSVKLALSELME